MHAGTVVIKKWGNSQGIVLTKSMMDAAKLKVNDVLDVEVFENEIVLKKPFRHRTFEERLAEYDGKISAYPFDWGDPKGRELL